MDKKFRLDISYSFKVTKSFCDMFEFYQAVYNSDIFITVFIFLFFKMLKLVKIF